MGNSGGAVAPTVPSNRSSEATRSLMSACKTLRRSRPNAIRSLQITLELDDLPVTDGLVKGYVQRIALEQGVLARACIGGRHVTVYLNRGVVPASSPSELSKNEVIGWVSRFFSWLSR